MDSDQEFSGGATQAESAQRRDALWRLERVVEGALIGTWEWQVQTGETVFSERWAQIVGYTAAELLPMSYDTWAGLTHPDDLAKAAALLQSHLAGELPTYDCDIRMRHKAGHWVWVRTCGRVATRSHDGKPLMMFGIHIDVTDRKRLEEEAERAEASNRAILEGLPDVVMRFDREGRHLFATENVVELTGIPASEFIGKKHSELGFPEPMCAFWEEKIRNVFESKTSYETEFALMLPAGEGVFFWRLIPELAQDGSVRSVLSISRDLTAHRRIERDYQTLFHSMLDAFALHEVICNEAGDPVDFRFIAVNPAFESIVGMRADDIVGRTTLEMFPQTEARWIEKFGNVALTGEAVSFEDYFPVLDRHLIVTAFRPAPNQFASIFRDITDRKKATEALQAKTEELDRYFDSSLDMLCIADTEGNFIRVNYQWERLLGVPKAELEGQSLLRLLHPEDVAATQEAWARLRAQEEVHNLVNRYVRADGDCRWVEWNARPNGSLIYAVARDVTDRRRMEEEKEKLRAQLIQAQKMESIGRLAGGVAHDFNNMLGVILGHIDLVQSQFMPQDPVVHDLREIRKAAERSAALTRQLLAFARRQPAAPKIINLNDAVESMLSMLRRLIGENITLNWCPAPSVASVKVDPSQVDQILANLCVNARDAIGEQIGTVTIAISNYCHLESSSPRAGLDVGDYVVLTFADTGCGMTSDVMAHLFEPFFTTKEQGRGTGLGLATVHGIVMQNRGAIEVHSEPGRGTAFTLYFPAFTAGWGTTPTPGPDGLVHHHGNETILLVEDEPAILELTRRILERHGYRVAAASTPSEAVRLAHQHQGEIQLLITDVVMPEMNGQDLARALLLEYPEIRLLYMSGYTADVIAPHGVLEEGVHFIQKPFTLQELTSKVRMVLDSPCTPI